MIKTLFSLYKLIKEKCKETLMRKSSAFYDSILKRFNLKSYAPVKEKTVQIHLEHVDAQSMILTQEIIPCPQRLLALSEAVLLQSGMKYEFFAKAIIEWPELLSKLNDFGLRSLGKQYDFFARAILERSELLSKLSDFVLRDLGKQYDFFARAILERPELLTKLHGADVFELARDYEFFAKATLKDGDLLSRLNVTHLRFLFYKYGFFASEFPEIAGIPENYPYEDQEKIRQAFSILKKHFPYVKGSPLYMGVLTCPDHASSLALCFCELLKANFPFSTAPDLYLEFLDDHEKCAIFLDGLQELSKANIPYSGNLPLFKEILGGADSARAILEAVWALQNMGIHYTEHPSYFNEYALSTHNRFVTYLLSNFKKSGFVFLHHKRLLDFMLGLLNAETINMQLFINIVCELCDFAKNGLLNPSEPEFEKQLQQLMDIAKPKLTLDLTFGPLNKSLGTLQVENILLEISEADIENEVIISFKEPDSYILILPKSQELNLSLLLRNANLTHLVLSVDLITAIGNCLQKLLGGTWENISLDPKKIIVHLPIAQQRAIELYTGLQYKNINKLFRSEPLSPNYCLHTKTAQNYLAYFLIGCLLNDAANKLKLLPEEFREKSDSILDRGERLTDEVIKARTQNPWIFPALTSFSLFRHGSPYFNKDNTKRTKLQGTDNAYVINQKEGEVIFAQGEQVVTLVGAGFLVSSIKRSPTLDPKYHYLSHVALSHAFENHLSIEYTEIMSAITLNGKKIVRPNHGKAHTYRMMLMIELVLQYFAHYAVDERFKEFCQVIEDDDIEWLRVASAFSITGRESEISAMSDLQKYDKYREKCREHFLSFVEAKASHMTASMKERMAHVIRYMGNPHYEAKENAPGINEHANPNELKMRNYIHRILTIAHKLDLVRCYNAEEYSRAMQLCHDLSMKSEAQEIALAQLIRYIVELNKAHGNKLDCDIGLDGKLFTVNLPYKDIFSEVSLSMKRLFEVTQTVKRPLITQQFEYSAARVMRSVA